MQVTAVAVDREYIPIEALVPQPVFGSTEKAAIIFDWDLDIVRTMMLRDTDYSEEEVDALLVEYRRYMAINVSFPESRHPLSKEVDDVWHAHILVSENYSRFCDAVFGQYFHHYPVFDDEGQKMLVNAYFGQTIPHLTALFGKPTEKFWQNVRLICWGPTDCN